MGGCVEGGGVGGGWDEGIAKRVGQCSVGPTVT